MSIYVYVCTPLRGKNHYLTTVSALSQRLSNRNFRGAVLHIDPEAHAGSAAAPSSPYTTPSGGPVSAVFAAVQRSRCGEAWTPRFVYVYAERADDILSEQRASFSVHLSY